LTTGTTDEVTKEYTRLFMVKATPRTKAAEEKNRWGDRAITVTDISTQVTDETITIYQTITAKTNIEQPIVGFRIRDASGKEVTGTNTKVEQQQLPNLAKGQSLKLTWQLPNILSDGQYTVDPAILHADGLTVADWWDDALQLEIKKSRHLPYAIDPSFKLELGKIHD